MTVRCKPKLLTLGNRQDRVMIRSYQKGFTLIEVIAIIIIVGLIGAIAIPKYISLTKAAEQGNVESVIGSLRSALALYSAKQIVSMLPITAHNPFDDLSNRPSNYAGDFGDVDLTNCPPGEWAYQIGNDANGNWPVVCYRPIATLTQAFTWGGVQWIILVVHEVTDANGTTIGLSLDDYSPAHQW
jgi:prepilin-type N-terminal cleavage/methylation domain-containing protein